MTRESTFLDRVDALIAEARRHPELLRRLAERVDRALDEAETTAPDDFACDLPPTPEEELAEELARVGTTLERLVGVGEQIEAALRVLASRLEGGR